MGRPYRYTFAPRAVRDLEKLPEAIAAACVQFIAAALADNPHRLGKPLLKPWDGHWSARRGSYRVIYRIDEQNHTVRVAHIDHRSHAYGHR
jgi:mRNA-degrading endonuclease RelE of RelBE toxin-antitoxin system